eukprot:1745642-Heterocapsa_arctica.AAC.1
MMMFVNEEMAWQDTADGVSSRDRILSPTIMEHLPAGTRQPGALRAGAQVTWGPRRKHCSTPEIRDS